MGFFERLLGRDDTDRPMAALYGAVVARARQPHWYIEGEVPDTVDGRFDMIAAVLAMAMLRMEDDPACRAACAALAERFVDDMDGQLRQIGVGDVVVGKHISKMMGMLGGRLGAYRHGLAEGELGEALVRNLYRGSAPSAAALAHVGDSLARLRQALVSLPVDRLLAGELPA